MKSNRRNFILLVLVVLLYIGCSRWHEQVLTRPYPQVNGKLAISGLQDIVIVNRDELGIPHIYAQNTHDLFLAQGFVHAQDRFWQMEFWRYAGQGRVSELVGPPGLEHDKLIRTISGPRATAQTISHLEANSPELLAILEAYALGVNQYLAQQNGAVSYNYTILSLINGGWEIEPWTPADSIAWGSLMAQDLSENYIKELRRFEALAVLEPAQVLDLFPVYLEEWPVITSSQSSYFDYEEATTDLLSYEQQIDELARNLVGAPPETGYAFGSGDGVGSNSWVVDGRYTTTGRPILANDPHLLVQIPSIWYQIGLHSPEYNVVGSSFAGAPGVVVGHNDHIAWGITNMRADVQDLYVERIDPNNPYRYELNGELVDMEVYTEQIEVLFSNPLTLTIRRTHRGPIITDVLDDVDLALSLRWTADLPSQNLKAILMLNRANDYESFYEALRYWGTPSQNFVYADVEGNIAYQAAGTIPIRRNGRGVMPVPGWHDQYDWSGYVPYEAMPHLLNPDQGYIVTANNAVVDNTSPHFIAYDWSIGDRAYRIDSLLSDRINSGEKLSLADMATIQLDGYSRTAEKWVPYILNASYPENNQEIQTLLQHLDEWDYVVRSDSVATSAFEIFYWHLIQNTIFDEFGEDLADLYRGYRIDTHLLMRKLAEDPQNIWWDNVNTRMVETRDDIINRSMLEAVDWLIQKQGTNSDNWEWQQLHQITFQSLPLGEVGVPFLNDRVNRGPYSVGGGQGVVNEQLWGWYRPVDVVNHPSMRMVIDVSDWDRSQAILSTGQSGHPGHKHYDDMIPIWLEGSMYPMWYTDNVVSINTSETLLLLPKR